MVLADTFQFPEIWLSSHNWTQVLLKARSPIANLFLKSINQRKINKPTLPRVHNDVDYSIMWHLNWHFCPRILCSRWMQMASLTFLTHSILFSRNFTSASVASNGTILNYSSLLRPVHIEQNYYLWSHVFLFLINIFLCCALQKTSLIALRVE